MSLEDALARVNAIIGKEDIKFMNLQFTDIVGIVKQITIPVDKWDGAVKHGIWFDGSSIEGFARIAESDMFLKPDLTTFSVVPWNKEPGLATARVICDVFTPDGTPFEGDPRQVLKAALKRAESFGLKYLVGPEFEFFLFKRNKDGSLLPLKFQDESEYFSVSTDGAHTVRRQMMATLQQFGLSIEASHHECSKGQHEIDFKYGDALKIADQAVTLRVALKAIAQKNDLFCSFMPKPLAGISGNGMHIHQSLWDIKTNENTFASEGGLSDTARQFIAGQLSHARGFTAIIAPLVNSYKRLVAGYEAPVYVSWATQNRSALIRIPRTRPNEPSSTRVELRAPDPSANPYLAFASILHAGLDGIEKKMAAPAPREQNLFEMTKEDQTSLETLPGDLGSAIRAMESDDLMRTALGEHTFNRFLEAKKQEWKDYCTSVSQWELDRYLANY